MFDKNFGYYMVSPHVVFVFLLMLHEILRTLLLTLFANRLPVTCRVFILETLVTILFSDVRSAILFKDGRYTHVTTVTRCLYPLNT